MLPFAGLAAAAAADTPDTTPPDGPPTSPSAYTYGESLVGVQWTNGDVLAQTQGGIGVDASTDPTSVSWTVSAGLTSNESGESTQCFWYVRHLRNGQTTAWVLALHPECPPA